MEVLSDVVTLSLQKADVFMILDALDSRAESYEETALALAEDSIAGKHTAWEEVDDDEEARAIAADFRAIEAEISKQLDSST